MSLHWRAPATKQKLQWEVTIQTDYQSPIGTTQLVELGGKIFPELFPVTMPPSAIDAATATTFPNTSAFSPANVFNYNQNVTAGYLSYTYNSKSAYSFKAGGRYEYTTITANFANPSAKPLTYQDSIIRNFCFQA